MVIEHNSDVINCADYVIDLGPEGGEEGGQIISVGTPEEIRKDRKSYTGKFLTQAATGPEKKIPKAKSGKVIEAANDNRISLLLEAPEKITLKIFLFPFLTKNSQLLRVCLGQENQLLHLIFFLRRDKGVFSIACLHTLVSSFSKWKGQMSIRLTDCHRQLPSSKELVVVVENLPFQR